MREWNADTYHRVSDPQFAWGLSVLERLPLRGDELVIDAGCGTGRLTEKLAERVPRGRVLAIDLSANMLATAAGFLRPRFGRRVSFAHADAAALPVAGSADAIFSTATFHWVTDHPRLFGSLHCALRPGGRLTAQCGGGPNIQRLHERCAMLGQTSDFASFFEGWHGPWEFAGAELTAARLRDAGFVDVVTSVEPAPVAFPDASAFREFVTNVVCRHHLGQLPSSELQDRYMSRLTALAAGDDPPYELDYWRLNLDAAKPVP